MSGTKYSDIQLEQERKARYEAMGRIERLWAEIGKYRAKIEDLLDGIPMGVAGAFPADIEHARDWLIKGHLSPNASQSVLPSHDLLPVFAWLARGNPIPTFVRKRDSTELNLIVNALQAHRDAGQACLHSLIEIKEVRRDARARELLTGIEQIEIEIRGNAATLNRWFPGTQDELLHHLESCRSQIEHGALVESARQLESLATTSQQRHDQARALQQQAEQRWYVFQSLREVCHEMGWGDVGKPALEDRNDPGSVLIYKTDTYASGIITFRLSLEGIQLLSPISSGGAVCHREFADVSERLKKFGVTTKFKSRQVPEDLPEDRARGEMDLPDEGLGQEMAR